MKLVISAHAGSLIFHANILKLSNTTRCNRAGAGDLEQLDLAATRADELADLLAEANGDKADPNESKIIRDKAYTHMKALVDEIREAGICIPKK